MTRAFLAATIVSLLSILAPTSRAIGEPTLGEHPTVVIIGVDGLSPRGLDSGRTPNLNRLLEMGSYTFDARAVLPTSSSPNWASMIMGAGPIQHGVTSNDWRAWSYSIEPASTGPEGFFPTLFAWTRAQRPDAVIGVCYDWGGFGNLFERSVVDLDYDGDGPEQTMARAIEFYQQRAPDLLFVHLDHVDGAGHGHGWHTDEYFNAVHRADRIIGSMLDAIDDAEAWSSTVVIVSSDHGGIGRSHGGDTMAEIEIPWLIAGAGIAQGRRITRPLNTYDTASTAAALLGIKQDPAAIGRPVEEAWARTSSGHGYERSVYVPTPRVEPAGRLVIADSLTVRLDVDDDRATIRYTLDGSPPTLVSRRYTGPIELDRSTTLRAAAFRGEASSRVLTDHFRLISPDAPRPVEYSYYEGRWESLPVFGSLTPVRTGRVPEIGLGFMDTRSDHFAVRFRAVVRIDEPGTHTFHLRSDDGSRLFLRGRRIIDNDGSHGPIEKSGWIDLEPGLHELVVEYFEDYGGETLELAVTGPDRVRRPVSYEMLGAPVSSAEQSGDE